jgi:hypothetical protein
LETIKGQAMSGQALADTALAILRSNWGSAYEIRRPGAGQWLATRRDGKGTIRAANAGTLLDMMRAGSFACPVPR